MNEGGRLESRKGWRKGKTTLTGKRKGERPEKKGTQKKGTHRKRNTEKEEEGEGRKKKQKRGNRCDSRRRRESLTPCCLPSAKATQKATQTIFEIHVHGRWTNFIHGRKYISGTEESGINWRTRCHLVQCLGNIPPDDAPLFSTGSTQNTQPFII